MRNEEKKTCIITFRTSQTLKNKIEKAAKEKEWSTSQVIEKIIKNHFKELEQ